MSSIDILTSTAYQSWMQLFGDKVEHLFVGRGACEPHSSFIAATKYINKLNKVSHIFPKLSLNNGLAFQKRHDDDELPIKIKPSKPLTKFNMLPSKIRGIVVSTEFDSVDQEVNEFWENAKANTNTEALITQIEDVQKASLSVTNTQDDNKNPIIDIYDLASEQARMCMNYGDNRLWFLGTGSAVPSKYRNVSGILLQIHHTKSSILLDVGEGTWQQMMKMALNCPSLLGLDENISIEAVDTDRIAYALAVQIKAAWISHPHADHHLGLIRLLSERKRLLLKYGDGSLQPLVLIAPASVLSFVRDYEVVESSLKDSYLPLSTRMFDSFDRCIYEDSFWFRHKESNPDNNSNGCDSVNDSTDNINPSETSFLSVPSLKAQLQDGINYLKSM
jgi:ribonuclease Z